MSKLESLNEVVPGGRSLMPFQETAIRKMLAFLKSSDTHSCYNACEQGLGKTIQAITLYNVLNYFRQTEARAARVLIICPAIMRLVWQKEIAAWGKTFGTQAPLRICTILKPKDALTANDADVVIMSYDGAATDNIKNHVKAPFTLLVCDEFHYCKNRKAKRTKAVLSYYWKLCLYRVAMSGTPFTARVVDGFTAFSAMMPTRFPNFFQFAEEFSYIKRTRFGLEYYGVKNPTLLSKIIRENFYIRYTKAQVLPELPPKMNQEIWLPVSFAVKTKLPERKALEEEIKMAVETLEQGKTPVLSENLAKIRKAQALQKVAPTVEFVTNILEGNTPVVLFCWHKDVALELFNAFSEYSPVMITGETPADTRSKHIADFQEGRSNVFIGTIAACNTGITLTRSSNVVFVEMAWTPAMNEQASDRCHRIGTHAPVNIYYMLVEKSIDESVFRVVQNRKKIFDKIV